MLHCHPTCNQFCKLIIVVDLPARSIFRRVRTQSSVWNASCICVTGLCMKFSMTIKLKELYCCVRDNNLDRLNMAEEQI